MNKNLIAVAPMMDWTDRHCRYFHRLCSAHVLLYTEMITTAAIIHGDRQRLLAYDPAEHPLALQLGGSCPQELAQCAKLAADLGYDEINLNVGCPSGRVQSGRFGACLMAEPDLVAAGVAAMQAAVDIPVTVKTRIGIDRHESYEFLQQFIDIVAATGCQKFIIHARNAWLDGLSPKQNRTIPPLRYDIVHRLKAQYPQLTIIINGGIKSLTDVAGHLSQVDGVMIGRESYHNPYVLTELDQKYFSTAASKPTRQAILTALLPYLAKQVATGVPLSRMTRHITGLFQGIPGARQWRRYLSEHTHLPGAGIEVVERAANYIID